VKNPGKEERASIAKKITEAIAELEEQIAQLQTNTQPISPENSIGRVSRMDAINNKGVSDAALSNRKSRLAKLKMALSKIDEPNFGICDRCGNAIALPRLMYMPESDSCVHCAR